MCKISIKNIDNYNLVYKESSSQLFKKYIEIINEYIKHCLENINIQDQTYYKYILEKGITTITYVFKFLLLYTKNIDIIYYNCQKSYIYYSEFIGQIGEENHSFLQLNSNDARLFVYKKTIFDIPNDFIKNYTTTTLDNKILDNIDLLIQIYNIILFQYIEKNIIDSIYLFTLNDLQNIIQKLIIVNDEDIKNNNNSNKLNAIFILITHFNEYNSNIEYADKDDYEDDNNISNVNNNVNNNVNELIKFIDIVIKKLKNKKYCDLIKLKLILLEKKIEDNKDIKNFINYIFTIT